LGEVIAEGNILTTRLQNKSVGGERMNRQGEERNRKGSRTRGGKKALALALAAFMTTIIVVPSTVLAESSWGGVKM
jgi:hypothetical protein